MASTPHLLMPLAEASVPSLVVRGNRYGPHDALRLRTREIDRQQSVFQIGAKNLHSVSQHEGALELAGRDAAMKEVPALVLDLAAADDELVFLDRDVELIEREPCDSKRDAETLRIALIAGSRSIL